MFKQGDAILVDGVFVQRRRRAGDLRRPQQREGQRHRIDAAVKKRAAAEVGIELIVAGVGQVGDAEAGAQAAWRAYGAARQRLPQWRQDRQMESPHPLHAENAGLPRRRDNGLGVGQRGGEGLFDQHRLCGSRQLSMLLEEPLPVNGLLGDRLA